MMGNISQNISSFMMLTLQQPFFLPLPSHLPPQREDGTSRTNQISQQGFHTGHDSKCLQY